MEVKIGVQNVSREIVIDTDQNGEEIQSALTKAVAGSEGVFVLTDAKGRKVIVPTDKIAYVEVATSVSGQVGFHS